VLQEVAQVEKQGRKSVLKIEKPQLCGFSYDGQSLASQGSPGRSCLRAVELRLAAGSSRTQALLTGSEAPDSLLICEPRASLAAFLIAVQEPFVMLPVIS
jgi:hypothetical protein